MSEFLSSALILFYNTLTHACTMFFFPNIRKKLPLSRFTSAFFTLHVVCMFLPVCVCPIEPSPLPI